MLDSIYHMTLRFILFLPNSGIVFMASSYKPYIQCNRFLLYIFFVFTLNVYLWILPSRLIHSFVVNENFMLSGVENLILLLLCP